MSSTEQRVALVTGGSRGIGRAVAERLAADGQDVAIVYAGDTPAAEAAVAAVTDAGGGAVAIRADVADEDAVRAAFDAVEERFGGVDVVVNSAGIMLLDTVADFDLADLDRMHRTNIRGTFVVNQQAARRVRRGGAIVNVSTSVGKLALPTYAAYAASKGAVDAISPVLAKELRGRDVTVNAVAPGPTATDLFLADKSEEQVERLAGMNPFGHLGAPEDIAEVVSFLAGPGRWVNGQILYANGGMV
ncbi:SDR family oxidoreductase [Nocardiopsis dassonvillei]|uniref:Short-chain dehydrogenase/reductase SDR n=1 Tax=Nocardiopsis dassonvillei (strain ATCC 23218 / DSM 43111 / CIP 107115 / JCM 7437 / KCTC 9190 / NBRC 14626 / NCTC 10488 / NRRL B-5397 / IMRU 509) TaxID=446468 RepID=D7AXC1_NOCDD|nr:SDR family oxidoreductase [Nocardiopsis dassonvillei]ADH65995.1 short-chain dehydrogenase/reductase SDR [Nocardiopsis dassonvillei subsp. dassonvillei DSM 43111]NKY79015.1 SDR family oxidoreductase [Nocardiopsis dassonvillei]VEI92016.1 3-oxoacyl-[acyl-carrier-protein] reductase FabG [Nocardiopsis dassonvillei]